MEEKEQEMHKKFLAEAVKLAQENVSTGRGGPFGAVIVKNGEIVRIVFDTGEYNEDDLDEMLSYYWEAVNSN